jgi:hypothetical protein
MTLLEGPPFAPELLALKSKFRPSIKFPQVFRASKMTILHTTTRPSSASYESPVTSKTGERTPTPPGSNLGAGRILLNASHERIDCFLPACTDGLFSRVKNTRYCNLYHLRECHMTKCTYRHGKLVKGEERNALLSVARYSPCPAGLHCSDPWCINGHACPRKSRCFLDGQCRFSKEMHNVDQVVVKVL